VKSSIRTVPRAIAIEKSADQSDRRADKLFRERSRVHDGRSGPHGEWTTRARRVTRNSGSGSTCRIRGQRASVSGRDEPGRGTRDATTGLKCSASGPHASASDAGHCASGPTMRVRGTCARARGKNFASPDRGRVSGEKFSRRVTEVLCSGTARPCRVTPSSRERTTRLGERNGCRVGGMASVFKDSHVTKSGTESRRPGPRCAGRCRTDAPVDHLRTSRESASTRRTGRELKGSECAID
jgi:hypothetical protein